MPWAAPSTIRRAAPSGVHFTPDDVPFTPALAAAGALPEVTLERLPNKRVVAVAHRGPYGLISDAFTQLDRCVRAAGLGAGDVRELVALYHDDPESTPPGQLRSDAGVVVSPELPLPAGLGQLSIVGGIYARALHIGPYAELGDAWSRLLGRWLISSGHRLGEGPMYERYLNTPGDAAPAELRTELYLSVAEPV